MDKESKRKILGAFIVGLALVGGAYTVGNFNAPTYTQPAAVSQPQVPPRTAIEVIDSDNNGIEDWRDDFVTTEPIIIDRTITSASYEEPDTLTGQIGVQFFQNILETRIYEQNPEAEERVIESTIDQLERETSGVLYDTTDISILSNANSEDIKNYANVMGNSLVSNSIQGLESETAIMFDVLSRGNEARISEIALIANYYQTLTESALDTPVPSVLVKEHLDLINTYHAMAIDIEAMGQALEDPIVSLMRMRKYEDNTLGLQIALENMYLSLLPYSELFSDNDQAVVFALFAPEQRI